MLGQNSILHANNVRHDPISGLAEARISPVYDHKIVFGDNFSRFIPKSWRNALDEIKEAIATRRDMGAVLNVVR